MNFDLKNNSMMIQPALRWKYDNILIKILKVDGWVLNSIHVRIKAIIDKEKQLKYNIFILLVLLLNTLREKQWRFPDRFDY